MEPMREIDYNYEYPLEAVRFGREHIQVRKMSADEMPNDGFAYYCEVDGSIYQEGESNFKLV